MMPNSLEVERGIVNPQIEGSNPSSAAKDKMRGVKSISIQTLVQKHGLMCSIQLAPKVYEIRIRGLYIFLPGEVRGYDEKWFGGLNRNDAVRNYCLTLSKSIFKVRADFGKDQWCVYKDVEVYDEHAGQPEPICAVTISENNKLKVIDYKKERVP